MPALPSASAVAVSLDNVAIIFGLKLGGCTAVQNIHLTARPGDFIAIAKQIGCGKSTLLNAFGWLLKPSDVKVELFGAPLHGLKSRAGYLFQQDAPMPWKTALQNVAVALKPKGAFREEAEGKARRLC
nr:ATP-binding cassette domain-containing protein [Microvirga lupini]